MAKPAMNETNTESNKPTTQPVEYKLFELHYKQKIRKMWKPFWQQKKLVREAHLADLHLRVRLDCPHPGCTAEVRLLDGKSEAPVAKGDVACVATQCGAEQPHALRLTAPRPTADATVDLLWLLFRVYEARGIAKGRQSYFECHEQLARERSEQHERECSEQRERSKELVRKRKADADADADAKRACK